MATDSNISLVTKNTIFFAEMVCETIRDMTGVDCKLYSDVFTDNEISLQQGLLILIPFSGRIQGNFYLCMDEVVAASVCGMYQEGMAKSEVQRMRSDFASFFLEVINVAAAKTISKLENEYRPLFAMPPYVIFGKAEMPNVTSGDVMIKGEKGTIQCALSVDLAKLRGEEKSEAAQANAEPGGSGAALSDIAAKKINSELDTIDESIHNMDGLLKKSKRAFLEGANQSLVKQINDLLKDTARNPRFDDLILEYQLIDRGIRTDESNIREEMERIEKAIRQAKEILAHREEGETAPQAPEA